MKFFSLVLVSCLVVVSVGGNPNAQQQDNVCLYNKQCALLYGESCFCYIASHEYYGHCVCNMERRCHHDEDCIRNPGEACVCFRHKGKGVCVCDNPTPIPKVCQKDEDCKDKPNQICMCTYSKGKQECLCQGPLYSPRS